MRPRSRRAAVFGVLAAVGCDETTLLALEPDEGSTRGGQPIALHGRGLSRHGAPVVYVGEPAATHVVVRSHALITAITPPLEPGPRAVRIAFEDGTTLTAAQPFVAHDAAGITLTPR